MELLKDKICLVTGGAKGIGKAIVRLFYNEGVKVIFSDIDKERGLKLQSELPGSVFYCVDVKDIQAVTRMLDNIYATTKGFDILINNVGIGNFKPITEITIEEFDDIIHTNLRTAFITSRYMAIKRNSDCGKQIYGRIINISSTRYLQSEPASEGYASSKGGIVSLTHALALSLSEYNITVNCISPGWIQNEDYKKIKKEDHLQHPSGRVGKPEDIASMCLYLVQPENDFINGQNIVIDGGMTKKMIYIE